jgi:HEPN domain-containing protein
VRLSQECVELSLKAVLKAVGIEYPKIHDVSDILIDFVDRFPEWLGLN